IHDWTRVDAGVFHSFHNGWIAELTKALNAGILPSEYYALGEQFAGGIGPDVISSRAPTPEGNGSSDKSTGPKTVTTTPPQGPLERPFAERSVLNEKANHRDSPSQWTPDYCID